jgi:SAM-dependent methyltransferase
VGVDFSGEAVRQAREHARRLGAAAEFRIGDLAATGLDTDSADAVLCVDAIHFAPHSEAAYREIARILTPGGRAVLTCWEPLSWDDQRLPEQLRRVDLRAGLAAAGFVSVEVGERPGWRAAERAMWEQAATLQGRRRPSAARIPRRRRARPPSLRPGPPGHSRRHRTITTAPERLTPTTEGGQSHRNPPTPEPR